MQASWPVTVVIPVLLSWKGSQLDGLYANQSQSHGCRRGRAGSRSRFSRVSPFGFCNQFGHCCLLCQSMTSA
ncbi:uncharacterized protein B0H64DRAFT_40441 [Chaetomium fimeti]|uniref:Secreted protein n=1 Tax=Chaetomium fimeti TaxID=1854472 RepID=A0AAE0LYL9_9PEZI|nr:hypothetical protein B0H64DRAFT_40441 [Chaetomium fimeti]